MDYKGNVNKDDISILIHSIEEQFKDYYEDDRFDIYI